MTESSPTFEAFLDRFIALYRQEAWAEALHLINAEGAQFPENASQLMAWQSAMLSRLGRVDEAVQVFKTADARGYWYDERLLRRDPDFEALHPNPDFQELVKRWRIRRQEAIPQLRPDWKVTEPDGPGPHPLCLVLHGDYSNIAMTEPLWRPMVAQGWTLATLQSSQPGWTNGIYIWDDVDQSLAQVKAQLSELMAGYALNPKGVIAAGFSMGAHIAVRMALDPAFHLRAVIAHEAWFDDEALAGLEQLVRSAPMTGTRVLLTVGERNEEYVAMARKVERLLTGRGFDCRLIYSSNPGHGYPPEFARLLEQAIEWVNKN